MATISEPTIFSASFDTPIDDVRRALTSPLFLSQWWAPPGYRLGFTNSCFCTHQPFQYTLLSNDCIETTHAIIHYKLEDDCIAFAHIQNEAPGPVTTQNIITLIEKNTNTHLTWAIHPSPQNNSKTNTDNFTAAAFTRLTSYLKEDYNKPDDHINF